MEGDMENLKFGNELLAGLAQMRDGLNTVIRIARGDENSGGAGDRKETFSTDVLAKRIQKHEG
jgi:hypothetical protein